MSIWTLILFYLSYKCLKCLWIFLRYAPPVKELLSKRKDLKRAGDWAIITGGTDGIGKAFAEELASDGLNIFLVSRSSEKLTSVSQELERKFKVETKTFVADFTKSDFYEALRREIESLSSVGCLINNVGMSQVCAGPMATCEFLNLEFMHRVIMCNAESTACMTRITLPKMMSHESDALPCVVNMSSVSGIYPRPFKSLYAACKSFVMNFSASVAAEYLSFPPSTKKNIRFLTLTPGFIWTPARGEKKTNFFIPTAEDFAKSALGMIGIASQCCGFMPHEIMAFVMGIAPECLRDFVVSQFERMQRKKYLQKLKSN